MKLRLLPGEGRKPMYDKLNDGSALKGLKVIDMGQMVAAPFCTSLMADMGADVVKVESPTGDIARNALPKKDGVSTYFINFNRSKRGITLNLKTEEGKEVLRRLIAQADVLVENFRPGVMTRLGFSYEEVSRLNPRLIYASISGFGQLGEYAGRACFDPIAQAISGMMSVTGSTGGEFVRCGASIADVLAGQNALIGILAALRHREETGLGQYIDVALTDSCIVALGSMNQIYFTTGKIPVPRGNTFEATAPGNTYPTKDGMVAISAGHTREWPKLARVLGREEWIDDPAFVTVDARVKNRLELDRLIAEETSKMTNDELLEKLLAVGLPAAPILNVAQVAENPHFRDARRMYADVEHPQIGTVRITNQGIKMTRTNPHIRGCAPMLGEHNRQILTDLGYTGEQIDQMRESGSI